MQGIYPVAVEILISAVSESYIPDGVRSDSFLCVFFSREILRCVRRA